MELPGRAADKRLLTACTISFFCFLASYMRMPIVPLLATALGADTFQVGMINGVFMLTACCLSIPSGLISDRLGRRVPLLGGLLILGASSFLFFWSGNLPQMAVIYLFFGVGLSTFSPALMAYVGDITPAELRGQAFGWYTMAMYAGMTLGPAAGGFLARATGLRPVFPVAGGLIFAMFFVALFFLPIPAAQRRSDHAHPAILPSLRSLMENRPLVACLVAVLGCCLGYGMFVTFMPLYIKSLGMNTMHVGLVFATGALTNTLSRLPAGRLCDRFEDPSILVAVSLAVFALALFAFGLCLSVASLIVTAAIMGIGMGGAFTVICALIAQVVPREMGGLAVGCYNTCIYAGMMLSSVCMGPVIRAEGFKAGFFINGALGLVALVLFRLLYTRQPIAEKNPA
ncbi:MFS transporter [Geobacter sp. AOG2]|uniref:MFS transporter n=1 Tax=Geobacter sp. AOG2 TaxID=1566347 RepID=UPI001CC5B749|nr:MFS transporter [Geobacter sp. AOG2]GFE59889.1 MFS transporter [Geobacter sp. AOG2]